MEDHQLRTVDTVPPALRPGGVWLIEAAAGPPRRRWLAGLAERAAREGARAFVLDMDFEAGGPWAGLRELLASLIGELRSDYPHLVARHADELAYILPELKAELGARHQTLTDQAPLEEKVRNYPADRAYRVVHGLIDLLERYRHAAGDGRPWIWVCDSFDRVSHIGRRFLRELARRRAGALELRLVLAVAPGAGADAAAPFSGEVVHATVSLPTEPAAEPDRAAAAARVLELTAVCDDDKNLIEVHVAELLRLSRLLGDDKLLLRWNYAGLDTYNSLGFYEDSLTYGREAWRLYHAIGNERDELLWALFNKLYMSNVGLNRSEEALRLVEESRILERPIGRARRAQLYYLLAMLHARHLPRRDLARAEEYLERALEDLQAEEIPEQDRHFYIVFNRNGLALVRHHQGRYAEAIALCRAGFNRLEAHLSGDAHKLHRSVLLYNLGQVYFAIGDLEESLRYYSTALEMDPAYAEYYNDRGSIYLRLGRLEEAKADYLRAIELSPPFQEVWTNLGQCHRLAGELDAALDAYSRAIDLDPGSALALHGRALVLDALGRTVQALADHERAVALRPTRWDWLGERAVLLFQNGEVTRALADLDRAIELAPGQADLYHNRAVALADAGRPEAAADDLRMYLRLAGEVPDRAEVEHRLSTLLAAA